MHVLWCVGGAGSTVTKTSWDNNCYLTYCNAFGDLVNAYCGRRKCTTVRQAAYCKQHWIRNGKSEHRSSNPDSCIARFASVYTGATYAKQSRKHCSGQTTGSSYNSLSAAQAACKSNQGCAGVYDSNCDGRAPYYMCKTGITYSTSSRSCVYTKMYTKGVNASQPACQSSSLNGLANAICMSVAG